MNILGLPTTKKPTYRRYDDLSKSIREYAPLDPQERNRRIDKDLVQLSEQREHLLETGREAHQKAKTGLLTMAGGLTGTVALGIAGDALPGPLGTVLKIGCAATTAVGIYSMFSNIHVRDFHVDQGLRETRTQVDFLKDWKKTEL